MGNIREIQEYVLCLVVEHGHLVLGEATEPMGYRAGKLVGPTGLALPNFNAGERVRYYCLNDMKIHATNFELVAQKHYERPSSAYDVLVHIYRVNRYDGLPNDTKRLRNVTFYPITALPFERMFSDDQYWLMDVISGREYPHLTFRAEGSESEAVLIT
ncbi:MAG: hypothetical protein WD157_00730 [Patescibacteria group bacterium]